MSQIFFDENHSCEIDFSVAEWATDQLHIIFHRAKLSILHDVDFVAETENEILLVEYKNANLPNAVKPEAFRPWEDKSLDKVARKYYESQYFLHSIKHGKHKTKKYVYILECVNGDSVLRKRVRELLAARLPFLLQRQLHLSEKMIDSLEVLSTAEWNEKYAQFPLKLVDGDT
jgi:hypothetical protein